MKRKTIGNKFLSLSVDERGRLVSLRCKQTGTEFITYPGAAEAWRMIVPTGRHTVCKLLGSETKPSSLRVVKNGGAQSLVLRYDKIGGAPGLNVRARFVLSLEAEGREVTAHVELDNRGRLPVDEVEFPVIGGLGGLPPRGRKRAMELVAGTHRGRFFGDVLGSGLPNTGRESNHFAREQETAMFEACGPQGGWADLHAKGRGLYVGIHPAREMPATIKIERSPKEVPNAPRHRYPGGCPRRLAVFAVQLPRLAPGGTWRSGPVIIMPHKGDWHAGADRYAAFRRAGLTFAETPPWMKGFAGWTEILGKTYLGEVFHDFRALGDEVIKDHALTGLDVVFYYGHTQIGSEGADFDQGPARDLGGKRGFRRAVERLHTRGIRIILLDHMHRWVNRDIPEYKKLKLARYAVLDQDGQPSTARWWKETVLSCRHLDGPTPTWIEMCPYCEPWRKHYLDQVARTVKLGADGLELDTYGGTPCYNPRHPHPPGANTFAARLDLTREARAMAKEINPDFVFIGETMMPEAREVLDGFYPSRYLDEHDRIHRYLFPEMREQAVLVGNYAFDQVNKSLALGIGIDTEIWGLRKTAGRACPSLARYIGGVTRLRRRYPEVLIRGVFRDTVGATVRGDLLYSVLEGQGGQKALVLRNPHDRRVRARASLRGVAGRKLRLLRPGKREQSVARLPLTVTLQPQRAAVLLALDRR